MAETERIVAKAWITKYALTEGIIEVTDARVLDEKYLSTRQDVPLGRHLLIPKADWFESLEEAQARYQAMLKTKVKSLTNQIRVYSDRMGRPCLVVDLDSLK
jgi:hypothetical protein